MTKPPENVMNFAIIIVAIAAVFVPMILILTHKESEEDDA